MPPSWTWYKKPSYVDIKHFAAALQEKAQHSPSSSPRTSLDLLRSEHTDVPSTLSLERILDNKTCSPMSLHDFYMYLKYIEYSPENLEFYLWYKEYEATYTASTYPSSGSTASRCWDSTRDTNERPPSRSGSMDSQRSILDVEKAEPNVRVVALRDAKGPCSGKKATEDRSSINSFSFASIFRAQVVDTLTASKDGPLSDAAKQADARRAELKNIVNLFLQPGSDKELNIPATMRQKALEAIATSSSPHHLKPIADHCYLLLHSCSHRNFIRLGVSNGTFETLCMATSVGIALTVAGFLCMILLAFVSPSIHQSSRWRGLAAWPMWTIGVGLLLSGLRGSCFFLLLFSRRQLLPWEDIEDDASITSRPPKSKLIRFFSKLMIFDRKVRVKDNNLRALQRKIVIQSILGGMLFATTMEVLFLLLPIWK